MTNAHELKVLQRQLHDTLHECISATYCNNDVVDLQQAVEMGEAIYRHLVGFATHSNVNGLPVSLSSGPKGCKQITMCMIHLWGFCLFSMVNVIDCNLRDHLFRGCLRQPLYWFHFYTWYVTLDIYMYTPEGKVSIHVTPRSLGSNWFIAIISIEWQRERSSPEIIHLTVRRRFYFYPWRRIRFRRLVKYDSSRSKKSSLEIIFSTSQ